MNPLGALPPARPLDEVFRVFDEIKKKPGPQLFYANVREPAAVSWWLGLDREGQSSKASQELRRMRTSPEAKWIVKVLE